MNDTIYTLWKWMTFLRYAAWLPVIFVVSYPLITVIATGVWAIAILAASITFFGEEGAERYARQNDFKDDLLGTLFLPIASFIAFHLMFSQWEAWGWLPWNDLESIRKAVTFVFGGVITLTLTMWLCIFHQVWLIEHNKRTKDK